MEVHYNGFNVTRQKIDSFRFTLPTDETTLNNLFFTFDKIYLVQDQRKLLIFDCDTNQFKQLEHQPNEIIISACSNSTNFWCLSFSPTTKTYQLFEYKEECLLNRIDLAELSDEAVNAVLELFMVSTDVNLYIFNNQNNELRCRFDLNSKRQTKQKFERQEKQLNENAASMMPLNKVLLDGRVVQACSGKEHVLLLLDNKQVYSFGIGTKGQLGHGKIENSYEPKLIDELNDKQIAQIATGNMGWHSSAIDIEGNCFVWGWNACGQLGLEDNTNKVFITKPTRLALTKSYFTSEEVRFKEVSLGSRHSAFIDVENNLYTCGWNKYEQLVQENINQFDDVNIEEPCKVEKFEKKTQSVKCGSWFTAIGLF